MKKVFIDCREEIPCNPCTFSCPTGAITIKGALTSRPEYDVEKCVGCANCVSACPGQACFLVDEAYSDTMATIDFPYEYFPLPEAGENVIARNNEGEDICIGQIVCVKQNKRWNRTNIVTMAVPKEYVYRIRGMARKLAAGAPQGKE